MKAAVLGAGAWGTALAKVLAERGPAVAERVSLWARRRDLCDAVNAARENGRYLPGVMLPPSIECTHDIAAALDGATTVVFVVPSHATRAVAAAAAPYVHADALVIGATKGIESDTLYFVDEILAQELPPRVARRLAFLSGPSFARELGERMPTSVVVASRDPDACAHAMQRLHTPYLRIYGSEDVVGVECGGALKNVIAIAAGAVSGMGFGLNTRAAIVTRGLAEVAKLAVARGGSALTLLGLAGLGDLVLTCTGNLSRNRTVGHELGRGRALRDVLATLGHVAEGVTTAKSAYQLAQKLRVDMPITNEVYAVLYEGKPVERAVQDLTERELGYEFDSHTMVRGAGS
jgi:glycerol-3-phosphate dehydrogenase (NAD(P)+)